MAQAKKCVHHGAACKPAKHLAKLLAPTTQLASNSDMTNLFSPPMVPSAAPAPLTRRFLSAYQAVLVTALALGLAATLHGAGAHAQTVQMAQTAQTAPAAAQTPAAPPAPAPAAEPKYTVAQIAQAFGLIDANKDGKLSREEAAGFRGVARHFDEADLNKDGMLSRKEFENALTGEKSR